MEYIIGVVVVLLGLLGFKTFNRPKSEVLDGLEEREEEIQEELEKIEEESKKLDEEGVVDMTPEEVVDYWEKQ